VGKPQESAWTTLTWDNTQTNLKEFGAGGYGFNYCIVVMIGKMVGCFVQRRAAKCEVSDEGLPNGPVTSFDLQLATDSHITEDKMPLHYKDQPFNPLSPELNPSAQRCRTRFFTGVLHFVNICVKNKIHQLFIQFINYIW
jgi:hypothetical protein